MLKYDVYYILRVWTYTHYVEMERRGDGYTLPFVPRVGQIIVFGEGMFETEFVISKVIWCDAHDVFWVEINHNIPKIRQSDGLDCPCTPDEECCKDTPCLIDTLASHGWKVIDGTLDLIADAPLASQRAHETDTADTDPAPAATGASDPLV